MPNDASPSPLPKRPMGRPTKVRASGGLASAALLTGAPGAEDPRAFAELALPLRAQLAPVGPLETLLAERIIGNAWRLRRALRFEAAHIQESLEVTERARRLFATATASSIPADAMESAEKISEDVHKTMPPAALQSLLRYEAFLEHSLYRVCADYRRVHRVEAGLCGKARVERPAHQGVGGRLVLAQCAKQCRAKFTGHQALTRKHGACFVHRRSRGAFLKPRCNSAFINELHSVPGDAGRASLSETR